LAAERDFAEITVRDITRRAEVNRNTFYLHYRDKDDLVSQALDILFTDFTAPDRAFVEAHLPLQPDVVPPPIPAFFRQVAERPELFRRLLSETGSSVFAARLRTFHEEEFLAIWHHGRLGAKPGSPPPELRAHIAATAVQGVIRWWLEHNQTESVETMATWLWDLLRPLWFGETVLTSTESR
jgi:AcrR family transcriptional regulator